MKNIIKTIIVVCIMVFAFSFFGYMVMAVEMDGTKENDVMNIDTTVPSITDIGDAHITTVVGALLHKHEYEVIYSEPDCVNDGFATYVCECGDAYAEQTVLALGHDFLSEIVPATCETDGYTHHFCSRCNETYDDEYVLAVGHVMPEEWTVRSNPNKDADGVEYRSCHCGYEETRTFECVHNSTSEVVVSNPTCTNEGVIHVICNICEDIVNVNNIPAAGHSFGNWKTVKTANPYHNGEKSRSCSCGKTETQEIEFKKAGNNSIYIESAGINVNYVVESFTQKAVDTYDVICNYSRLGGETPIVLGHNTGSLKKLYNTAIGSYIYFYVNGELNVYKVTISEKATEVDAEKCRDIQGLVTGTLLLSDESENTIRLYTCYNDKELGKIRWLVFAEKVN